VLQAEQVRLTAASNFALAYTRARLSATAGSPEPPPFTPGVYSGTDAAPSVVGSPLFRRLIQPFVSGELGLAWSPFGVCEGGITLGLPRAGIELRCGVLDEQRGDPFALALSVAAAHQLLFVPLSNEARAGLDVSVRVGSIKPLLDVYIGHGPHQWVIADSRLPPFQAQEWNFGSGHVEISSQRTEWTLSVPMGIALAPTGQPNMVVLGVVPQFILAAENRKPPSYGGGDSAVVSDFRQLWSLYFTVGMHVVL
jgi:hypothetical protein